MGNNNLAYVHQAGGGSGEVGFKAWDGEDYSQLYDLKIQVYLSQNINRLDGGRRGRV